MKIKKIIFPFVISIMIFFCGCSNYVQLHQKLIVQAIGVDQEEEGKYSVTVQALDFKNLQGDDPTVKVLELEGLTVMDALGNISSQTGLKPLYSQNLILVIGKSAAEKGVNRLIDFFIHHYEARPNVAVCLSESEASDVLNLESDGKILEAKNILDMINKNMNSDIMHFVGNIQSDTVDPYVPCLRVEKKEKDSKIFSDTVAIFDGDTLSNILDKELSLGVLLINGVSDPGMCVLRDLENFGTTAFKLDKVKSKIDVNIKDNRPEFFIDIKVDASTFEIDKNLFTGKTEEIKKTLEKRLAEKLKEISQQALLECMRNSSDIFGFGKKLSNKYPHYFKSLEENWKESIKNCEYNLNIEANVADIGIFS